MIEINLGDILNDNNKKTSYRIIYIIEDSVVVCKMNINKLELYHLSIEDIKEKIFDGLIICEHKSNLIFDLNKLNEKNRQQYERNKQIIEAISETYGPSYLDLMSKKRKPVINKLLNDFNISRDTVSRICVKYLQSGMDDLALFDTRSIRKSKYKEYNYQHRPGKKSENAYQNKIIVNDIIIKQFDEALERYRRDRFQTLESSYTWLCNKYYTQTKVSENGFIIEPFESYKIPTIRQFRYYAHKKITQEEKDVIKTSQREVRNDKRLLLSDSLNNIYGPGDMVEIDAVEVDLSIVSEVDRSITIGRPIMYLMVDIYTKMIIAMSVSLDNNSVIGLTNLFLNLADNKVDLCSKYNITIDERSWISEIIPRHIRTDRGADFRSDKFALIMKELGIDRQLVSAASGSLKGTVEQEFRSLHYAIKPHLGENGVISKRYDSKHHEKASLTIKEFTSMAIDFVLHHNMMPIEKYPYTADMLKQNVHATPYDLWKYGCKKYGNPRPITNIEQYCYTLMESTSCAISRKGIRFFEWYYMNWEDKDLRSEMYALKNKSKYMELRYDPRDMSKLYYINNKGKLLWASLNEKKTSSDGFVGMTFYDLMEYRKRLKELQKENKEKKRIVKNSLYATEQAISETACSRKTGKNSTHNLRENRNIEKQIIQNEHRIEKKLCSFNDGGNNKVTELDSNEITNDQTINEISSFEEAFDKYC